MKLTAAQVDTDLEEAGVWADVQVRDQACRARFRSIHARESVLRQRKNEAKLRKLRAMGASESELLDAERRLDVDWLCELLIADWDEVYEDDEKTKPVAWSVDFGKRFFGNRANRIYFDRFKAKALEIGLREESFLTDRTEDALRD